MGPEQAPPPILAVHPDGSRPPLVFFHTWFHEADHLQSLGQELGGDQPLYAVDHPPSDGALPEDLTLNRTLDFCRAQAMCDRGALLAVLSRTALSRRCGTSASPGGGAPLLR